MPKKAIITGITGQDGSYLAELLLDKGYEVHGMVRRASTENFDRIAHLGDRVRLHQADLLDQLSIIEVLREVRPDEVYNLAAMSFVPTSWKQPVLTGEFTGIGVTRKVTDGVARIKVGLAGELRLGNLDAQRDWGFAGDYVKAMWLMLQQDRPDDYVIATGQTRSVRDLVQVAFDCVGLDWQKYVVQDPALIRPAEVDLLIGDASKAQRVLGWRPEVTFEGLVHMMVEEDLKRLSRTRRQGDKPQL